MNQILEPGILETLDLYGNEIELEFAKAPTKDEKNYPSHGFAKIPKREGWEVVYMPYGINGKGYYYKRGGGIE